MNEKTVGFNSDIVSQNEDMEAIFSKVIPEDLMKYGLIPELVGRIPVMCSLHKLTEEALITILTKPKNSICKQYQKLFEMEDVKLEFSKDALKEIAHIAIKQNTGARGLRSIIEKVIVNVMYDLPELENAKSCLISKDVIVNGEDPIFVFDEKRNIDQSA